MKNSTTYLLVELGRNPFRKMLCYTVAWASMSNLLFHQVPVRSCGTEQNL